MLAGSRSLSDCVNDLYGWHTRAPTGPTDRPVVGRSDPRPSTNSAADCIALRTQRDGNEDDNSGRYK
jgi:hypothetical protein